MLDRSDLTSFCLAKTQRNKKKQFITKALTTYK